MRLLLTPLKWAVAFSLLGGLLFGLFLIHKSMRAEMDREAGETSASRAQSHEGTVHLEEDEVERYGLETETAQTLKWYAQATVDGRIVPNPQATTEVRSPFAGTLRTAPSSAWPSPGRWVRAGQTVGRVEVRVGPEVRLDLQNKLADARIKQRGAEEEITIHQDRVKSLKAVTSQEIIARNELDTALVQLAQAKTQAAAARSAVELWQKAVEEVERHKGDEKSYWSQPLLAPSDGEVTELAARPGMSVEAGAVVVQLVDFRHPLIRLDIPPEIVALGGPPQRVGVQVPSLNPPALGGILSAPPSVDSPRVDAQLLGPAPQVDVTSQFVGYWYEARLPRPNSDVVADTLWRPGMQVTARVRAAGSEAQAAVAVPATAVLYHEGHPLVYVRTAPDTFQRREVRLLGRESDRWILAIRQGDRPDGVTPEEAVVSRQAQVLLSREFLAVGADND